MTLKQIREAGVAERKIAAVRKRAVAAIHLYGQSHGRDLLNTIWEIIREIESEEFCDRLEDDPSGVFRELYAEEE